MVMFSQDEIRADLKELGVKENDRVLVHTSLKKVGMVDGGPEGFVKAIVATVGDNGLAVFPGFTGTAEDSKEKPPYFDVLHSKTWTGKVPEAARARTDAIRSLHPTHSVVAIGKEAKELTRDHEYVKTPCGVGSPFVKLAESGGKILLVGVGHNSNTTFHTAEEFANCPYHMLEDEVLATIVGYDRVEKQILTQLHKWGTERDFNIFDDVFNTKGIQKIGKIGKAECRLIESGPMLDIIVPYLKKDPNYMVVKR